VFDAIDLDSKHRRFFAPNYRASLMVAGRRCFAPGVAWFGKEDRHSDFAQVRQKPVRGAGRERMVGRASESYPSMKLALGRLFGGKGDERNLRRTYFESRVALLIQKGNATCPLGRFRGAWASLPDIWPQYRWAGTGGRQAPLCRECLRDGGLRNAI
jgi:hypothetical protein